MPEDVPSDPVAAFLSAEEELRRVSRAASALSSASVELSRARQDLSFATSSFEEVLDASLDSLASARADVVASAQALSGLASDAASTLEAVRRSAEVSLPELERLASRSARLESRLNLVLALVVVTLVLVVGSLLL